MIPVYLDPARVRIALVGRGTAVLRRLAWLDAAKAQVTVWSDEPSAELIAEAGDRLRPRLPDDSGLQDAQMVWIAGLPADLAGLVVVDARAVRAIVNVEDVARLCDFHSPAVVRRGKLTLAAGTGGTSPAAASAAREQLEEAFPETWATALEEIAEARTALRTGGASFDALIADARARLSQHGLV